MINGCVDMPAQNECDSRPALQSHLLNGRSPLRTSVGVKEQEKLTASIIASNNRRQAVDHDSPPRFHVDGHDSEPTFGTHPVVNAAARHPRDEPTSHSRSNPNRPASPYTRNPPIDFDGLSWPSEFRVGSFLRCHG